MTTTTTITARVFAYNDGYITDGDGWAILGGTEGLSVTLTEQRKSKSYRVIVTPGVRDFDGGFWPCESPSVFYARPTRNFGPKEITRHFANVVCRELGTELPVV